MSSVVLVLIGLGTTAYWKWLLSFLDSSLPFPHGASLLISPEFKSCLEGSFESQSSPDNKHFGFKTDFTENHTKLV